MLLEQEELALRLHIGKKLIIFSYYCQPFHWVLPFMFHTQVKFHSKFRPNCSHEKREGARSWYTFRTYAKRRKYISRNVVSSETSIG